MKFRNLFSILVLGVVLSACAPVAGAFVQLDPALANWVTIAATLLVGILFAKAAEIPLVAKLLEYLHAENYKMAISAWLAGVVVQFLQAGILDKIPAMWDNVVAIVMQLLVAVIVTLYGFHLLAKRGVKGFRS